MQIYKDLLSYMLALMLVISWSPLVAKETEPASHKSPRQVNRKHVSLETQIQRKYNEIDKLKAEIARLNARLELNIQKKYEEIDKLRGGYRGYSGVSYTQISYP